MKSKPIKLFLLLLAFASFSAQSARAYSSQFADEGGTIRLRWRNGAIPIAVSASLARQNLNIKTDGGETALGAVRRSLDAWEKIANVKFELVSTDKQSISPSGKSGDGVSLITVAQTPENLLLFGGGGAEEVSAGTRTFFSAKGIISEADIVLNPYQQFSTDGSLGTFDLEATLTHEIGHLLGLEHTTVAGATMFERQGKNGTYGLPNLSARTLSEDDIAGARAIYGAKGADAECCGTVVGKFSTASGKAAKDIQVWTEEAETGRVAAAVLTSADGAFRIEGLSAGRYSIYAQGYAGGKNPTIAAQSLGTVEVARNKITNFTRKLKTGAKTFDWRFIGFNSQLSELAVPLDGGKSFVLYAGGKNLDAANSSVGFNSPYFTLAANSLILQDFGADVSAFSFEIRTSAKVPGGEYSFFIKSKSGETAYSVGGLTVEEFGNSSGGSMFSSE